MNAPPPTPELWGSTSESIACTATAASTALPPRFSTFKPARAASGLAAITNGSAARVAAGALAQVPRTTRLRRARILLNRRIPDRLADEEWRFKSIPLRRRAGEQVQYGASARAFRQSGFAVSHARGRERRQAVPLGEAWRRVALDQLGRRGAAGGGARGEPKADRAP